jgi:hypothetical protein
MDFEERIAYYKDAYAAEGKSDNQQNHKTQKEGPESHTQKSTRVPASQKQKNTIKTSEQKQPEPSVSAAQTPQKKRGLLARLLKRVQGDA